MDINKYRKIDPNVGFPGATDPQPVDGKFDKGLNLSQGAQKIELDQSRDLDKVRVEEGALRADFGTTVMGAAAPSRVLALGEHKFVINTNEIFEKIFRVYTSGADLIQIETWDGSAWAVEISSPTIILNDVLLSWRSFFNLLFFADGDRVIMWDQSNLQADQGDDFPAGNELVAVDDTADAIITPAGGVGDVYTVNYSLLIEGPTPTTGSVVVSLEHVGVEIATRTATVEASSDPTRTDFRSQLSIEVTRQITDGDALTLKLKSITSGTLTRQIPADTNPVPPHINPDWVFDKVDDRPAKPFLAIGEEYLIVFTLQDGGFGGTASVEFWVLDESGVWALAHTETGLSTGGNDYLFPQGAYVGITAIGIQVAAADKANGWDFVGPTADNQLMTWGDQFSVVLHGFNLATDGDAEQGVTYASELAETRNELIEVEIVTGTPLVARYLGVFADRLVALQIDGDPQKWAVSVNSDPDNFEGIGSDEGLLPSNSDAVDDLMAIEKLTANLGALFRKRSIMRAVPTGNVLAPIAFFDWIPKLGTESPFSVKVTPYGIMFVGNNLNVYLLTESGPIDLGTFINDALTTISDPSAIEAEYDPTTGDYILTVPVT